MKFVLSIQFKSILAERDRLRDNYLHRGFFIANYV